MSEDVVHDTGSLGEREQTNIRIGVRRIEHLWRTVYVWCKKVIQGHWIWDDNSSTEIYCRFLILIFFRIELERLCLGFGNSTWSGWCAVLCWFDVAAIPVWSSLVKSTRSRSTPPATSSTHTLTPSLNLPIPFSVEIPPSFIHSILHARSGSCDERAIESIQLTTLRHNLPSHPQTDQEDFPGVIMKFR